MKIREVLETCLYAEDLDAAEQFYHDVLGLELLSKMKGRHVFFRCGDRLFLLFNPKQTIVKLPVPPALPTHGAHGPGHTAFAIREDEILAWSANLRAKGVAIEYEAAWPEGGHSIYFRDPAGNLLELATARTWGIDEPRIFTVGTQ